ncbi:phage head-tail connector protein [Paenibacillus alvei]|uniref:Putative phage protein n=1 Tax=Paenibacillus alvei TaxID=44250 RepID=A0A383RDR6_PAEAL|nr:phage head-tail connector protein [Paenibacillus alvei]SYX84614.1 putative phage protein [Paenibacillus alvei]
MIVNDIWPIVKSRLGLPDDTHKDLISSYIEEIGNRIKHYCAITTIPETLKFVWSSMVIDACRIELSHIDEIDDTADRGESIKVGDTSSAPATSSGLTNTSKTVIDSVVTNYRVDLNRYRRLRW